MDGYELTSHLANAATTLAWPGVALAALKMLGPKVDGWIQRLRSVEGFGVKAEFQELDRFEAVLAEASEAAVRPDATGERVGEVPGEGEVPVHGEPETEQERGIRYSIQDEPPVALMREPEPVSIDAGIDSKKAADPAALMSILSTWEDFVEVLVKAYLRKYPHMEYAGQGKRPSLLQLLTTLRKDSVINALQFKSILAARDVRNAAAHGKPVSIADARRFSIGVQNMRLQVMQNADLPSKSEQDPDQAQLR